MNVQWCGSVRFANFFLAFYASVIFYSSNIAKADTTARHSKPSKPNVLFILADDLGYGDLGCYGNADIKTPVLDQFAKQGVQLTNHYANGPECTPTRVALLTGRYQQWVGGLECAIGTGNVGRYDDAVRLREQSDLGLPVEQSTLVRNLRDQGYRTAMAGKWHLGYEVKFAPNLHGFEETFYCIGGGMDYFHYLDNKAGYNLFEDGKPIRGEGYFTDMITDRAINFLKRQTPDQPFFLYVPYTCPHFPFQGPEDYQTNPLPLDSSLWDQNNAPPEIYRAMIEHMDRRIGDLLDTLDQSSQLQRNTLVIFASDNGGSGSARNEPFSGIKGETYEGGIRVPAILRWPGVLPTGAISNQTSLTFDFSIAIANLAGVPSEKTKLYDGMDIVEHLRSEKPDQPRTLYWRKPRGNTVWMGIRDGDAKLVAKSNGNEITKQLFHLGNDPSETSDLAVTQPEEVTRLWDLYRHWEQLTRENRRGRQP
jgi:arylsulfatase A